VEIYLVGGAVRDQLLKIPVKDKDWVVVGASPDELLEQGYIQVGKDFPVFLHPDSKQEYALARTERKSGQGYTGFTCDANSKVTLKEDLLRRDLTINSLAKDSKGNIIDPFSGLEDLRHKKLRHVSEAFREDPLRILRIARFAARFHHLGFTIADETMALMKEMTSKGELEHLTAERVWLETVKASNETDPHIYFEVLQQCGGLTPWFEEWQRVLDHVPEASSQAEILLKINVGTADHSSQYRLIALSYLLDDKARFLFHRLKAPKKIISLAKLMPTASKVLLSTQYDAEDIQKLFKVTDAYRQPDRFDTVVDIVSQIADGLDLACAPLKTIKTTLDAALAVDPQSLIDIGLKGPELGKALEKMRLKIIRTHLPEIT